MASLPDWDDDNWDQVVPPSNNQHPLDDTTHRDAFSSLNIDHPYYNATNAQSQGFVDEKLLLPPGDDKDGGSYVRSIDHNSNHNTGIANVDHRPVVSSRRAHVNLNFNAYPPPQTRITSKTGISNRHNHNSHNDYAGTAKGNYYKESMTFHEPLNYSSLQQGTKHLMSSNSSPSIDRQHLNGHQEAANGSYSYSRVDLPTFDEFRCREVCLTASNKIKCVHDYLRNVKQHILQERTFTAEVRRMKHSSVLPHLTKNGI